jgi:subtilisin family serine protease
MRMPPRPDAVRSVTLAALAVVAAALALAGAVSGAGDSISRMAARSWDAVFGNRAAPAAEPRQRVFVVLSAPSLADRIAAANGEPSAGRQHRWTADAGAAQELLLEGLRKRGLDVRPDEVFTRTFNGFSALVGARALAELERAQSVAGIYPVRTVYPAASSAQTLAEKEFALGQGRRADVALPGFDGSGVTIALLDTGVDREHPFLRGRVLQGFDVFDGERTATPAAKPGDPSALESHGTRMAGLLVGRGGPSALRGVAPGATVLPIRVLGWSWTADGGWDVLGRGDQLLAGLERAVDPDADGDVDDRARIALVGGVEPYAAFADSPEARAVAGAASLGTLVVAPVGNDGRPGAGFGSVASPAAGADALAVGALDARRQVLQVDATLEVGSETVLRAPVRVLGATSPRVSARFDVAAVTGPTLADPGRAEDEAARGDELGDFFAEDGASLVAGKAVVIRPEGGSIERRVRNAARAGAAAVLVTGTSLPAGALDLEEGLAVPVLALPASAGADVMAARLAGEPSFLELAAPRALPNPALMDLAPFSSGGVAFDGRVKPDLVAPGVGLATSDTGAGYATLTGTSAAAAIATGAAALVAEARPTLSARELKSVLVGSGGRLLRRATPLRVTAQGGGLVDPVHAATAELAVEPATLAFGRDQGKGWTASRTLILRNVSTRTLAVGLALVADDPTAPQLAFSANPARVTIRPGRSARMAVGVLAKEELPEGAGGVLIVSADGAQPVRVPWAVATRVADRAPLVGDVQLSHHEFAPSDVAPVVVAFRAGRVDQTPDGETIEPVGVLDLELWTAGGEKLGLIARLRDVLPGRYAFGLTGRGPNGEELPAGEYVLRLRAYSVDGEDGSKASTDQAEFTITH